MTHDRVAHQHRPPRKSNARQTTDTRYNKRYSTENVPDCDVILHFAQPGVQRNTVKKLKQGKYPVEASLDLHGYTAEQARNTLIEFLEYCQSVPVKVACIVHGKGFGSDSKKPVIKPLVNKWLQETPEILAFCSAQPRDGGTGAVYVLFKRFD